MTQPTLRQRKKDAPVIAYSASVETIPSTNEGTSTNASSTSHDTRSDISSLLQLEFGVGISQQADDAASGKSTAGASRANLYTSSELLLSYVKVPVNLETFLSFGLIYCLVVLLKWLIIVPLRFFLHGSLYARSWIFRKVKGVDVYHHSTNLARFKDDALSVLLTSLTLLVLRGLDESKIYHRIKSGTAVKLYFLVGLLEIADKLLSAAGQDIMNLVFSIDPYRTEKGNVHLIKFALVAMMAVLYLSCHSTVLVYQVMALNVAVNSYSNALLTLILSSQFSELKGSVFKRIEREGLFQLTCADLTERFLLLMMLIIISSRNIFQMFSNRSSDTSLFDCIKPNSWYSDLAFSETLNDWIGLLIGPSFVVIGSEFLVDWLKHSYITKFNRIRPRIYLRYTKILARDYIADFKVGTLDQKGVNRSHKHRKLPPGSSENLLLKRTGLPIFTVVIVFCKLTIFPWLAYFINTERSALGIVISLVGIFAVTAITIVLRTLVSLAMLKWSNNIVTNHSKPEKDFLPGNPNVNLADASDVREEFYDHNETVPPSLEEKRLLQGDGEKLDSVVRFSMADKRIW